MPGNPCLSCGACCAHYRVSFYWSEADAALGGVVPVELAEELTTFLCCMQGTNRPHPRCVALEGTVGEAVYCRIYDLRPSPCREFGINWEGAPFQVAEEDLARCNQARAAWGLPPLTRLQLAEVLPGDTLPHQPPHSDGHDNLPGGQKAA